MYRIFCILYIADVRELFIQSTSRRGRAVCSCKGFKAFGDSSKQGSRGIGGLACLRNGCLWIKRLWEELLDFCFSFRTLLGLFLLILSQPLRPELSPAV